MKLIQKAVIKQGKKSMFQKYRDNMNDNPKGYWFRAKPFGPTKQRKNNFLLCDQK